MTTNIHLEDIQEKIKDLEFQMSKIDGHTLGYNLVNRLHGTLGIGLGALLAYVGTECNFPVNIIEYTVGSAFIIDGIGALSTGSMHYFLFRVTRSHPKYQLQKIMEKKHAN